MTTCRAELANLHDCCGISQKMSSVGNRFIPSALHLICQSPTSNTNQRDVFFEENVCQRGCQNKPELEKIFTKI